MVTFPSTIYHIYMIVTNHKSEKIRGTEILIRYEIINFQESGIKINDVIYSGIMGTSATKVAIKMDCSEQVPCTGIRMQAINLTYYGEAAETSCTNVSGKQLGLVTPSGCL